MQVASMMTLSSKSLRAVSLSQVTRNPPPREAGRIED